MKSMKKITFKKRDQKNFISLVLYDMFETYD